MKHQTVGRVLAIDLHPRRFGYVVVESPRKLLDWGVRSYHCNGNPVDVLIQRGLKPLLALWRPAVILIRGPRQTQSRQKPLRERLLKGVIAEARTHRARVQILTKRPTDRTDRLTKYECARAAVQLFPVLTRRLPPKRKPWESEHYSMSLFEALAVAVQYPDHRSQSELRFNEST
jgi:hypothetical protein